MRYLRLVHSLLPNTEETLFSHLLGSSYCTLSRGAQAIQTPLIIMIQQRPTFVS